MKANWLLLFVLIIGMNTASAQLGSIFAVALGDSVTIYNTGVVTNCAARFVFDVVVYPESLCVVERDTSTRLATCLCGFGLSTTVNRLQPGTYTARVYQSHVVPSYVINYVGSAQFVIQATSAGQLSFRGFQSACSPNSVHPTPHLPSSFGLEQNFPNPFNPTTVIKYQVPPDFVGTNSQLVSLKVYDLLGRVIATLVDEEKSSGEHMVTWDANGAASGVYYCKLSVAGFTQTRQMVVLR